MFQSAKRFSILLVVVAATLFILPMKAFAEDGKVELSGLMYEFDKDNHYDIFESDSVSTTDSDYTYGTFFINGEITATSEKSGILSYEVGNGNLEFYYNYGDTLLNVDEDSWHLVDDKSKKVAGKELDSNIMKGAIILQTSKDQKNWIDEKTICNAFSDVPIRTSSIYSTTDVQLINGCYYRLVVVYELAKKIEDRNFLFINTDKYDYKKCAEVYEFYACADGGEVNAIDLSQTYSLGSRVKVKNFDGYFGEELIDKNDVHYGWELGNFFVSGYTDEVTSSDGNIVFLKNVGDKVTLWFKLDQDINCLNGKKNLSITADTEGYDQYFETSKMDFGHGVLIIRYTDHNNVKATPTIYTNYLEANAVVGADTKVQLFEEGDYEVALDYEVTKNELIDKIGHYRIFFKFSVRNGNCMVYPFDVRTGSELTSSSLTENGFRLDLDKSRYLKINIKREILTDSADGLIEDTRFNGSTKDGAEYTEEGIYTITVNNEYTGQVTTKKIYVGTNNILRAHMTTGLSIPEINDLVAEGATISEDGTIQPAVVIPVEESAGPEEKDSDTSSASGVDVPVSGAINTNSGNAESDEKSFPIAAIVGVIICIFAIVVAFVIKKKEKQPAKADNSYHDETKEDIEQ